MKYRLIERDDEMKINEVKEQIVDVEVYILDEVNDREIYVKTIPVQTKYKTFRLRTDKDELRNVFDEVVYQLKKQDNVKMIARIINPIELEQVGEFEQIIHGRHEIFTLRFKIKN
jgi:predicted transcriptional regulator